MSAPRSGLIAVIGDEDTVTGFLLAGIGQRNHKGETNFLVVEPQTTTQEQMEQAFVRFTESKHISIILINQNIADEIRHLINDHTATIPTVLEIPSKDQPYDPEKDPIVQRVQKLLGRD